MTDKMPEKYILPDVTVPEPFSEEGYEEGMKTTEAFLSGVSSREYFKSFDGGEISYMRYKAADPKANIVISIGFTEFAEKYTELAYYLVKSNFNVFTIEHRGHGYSQRGFSAPQTTHIDSFDTYVNDFTFFLRNVVFGLSGALKTYLVCHSMGCTIAALALAENDFSSNISGAVFASPMVSLAPKGVTECILLSVVKRSIRHDGREAVFKYAPTFSPDADFKKSGDTSFARFRRNLSLRADNEKYQGSSYTNSWLYESIKASKSLISKASSINVPCLVLTGENDTAIKRPFQENFASAIPSCDYYCVSGAKHSLFTSEHDKLREVLTVVYGFIESH